MFGMTAVLVVIYMPKGIGGLLDRFLRHQAIPGNQGSSNRCFCRLKN